MAREDIVTCSRDDSLEQEMQKTLMMVSGLLAKVRFPFIYIVLAVTAVGCAFIIPWVNVWGFMKAGPIVADGFLATSTCFAMWIWVFVSIVIALTGLLLTFVGVVDLSEYPLWWIALTVDKEQERHVELWRVLVWLLFVPADLANLALLPVRLLVYPWRLLGAVMAFDLAKLGSIRDNRKA